MSSFPCERHKPPTFMAQYKVSDIVELDFHDLISNADLSKEISKAFGIEGVGVLTVKNVPHYVAARDRLLPLSRKFANLPEDVKEKYVHKGSSYSFGWSHGKENLQGKPDLSKGSFYANPQYDRPVDDEETINNHAPFVHPNIWPTDDLPELEEAFKCLGQIIVQVGKLVARQCDSFVHSKCASYPENSLENVIEKSLCCKARLLHYFPITTSGTDVMADADDFSSWCGWHNDHGSLTGLTSALFMDSDGNVISNADPTAGEGFLCCLPAGLNFVCRSGLYIRSRQSELIKVNIPEANIAFQIGETAQVHSGGILQVSGNIKEPQTFFILLWHPLRRRRMPCAGPA